MSTWSCHAGRLSALAKPERRGNSHRAELTAFCLCRKRCSRTRRIALLENQPRLGARWTSLGEMVKDNFLRDMYTLKFQGLRIEVAQLTCDICEVWKCLLADTLFLCMGFGNEEQLV